MLIILVLLINIQISILPTRPPEKNYQAGFGYPPDFCGKNPNPAQTWKVLPVTALVA